MSDTRRRLTVGSVLGLAWLVAGGWPLVGDEPESRRIDPAGWGSDHVGQPVTSYMTGDECLFCHRKIGPTWLGNRHQLTIRPADPDTPALVALREIAGAGTAAGEVQYLMGSRRKTRFLKRSPAYGKLDMLTASFRPAAASHSGEATKPPTAGLDAGELQDHDSLVWDPNDFGRRCAGCHTTAVHAETQAFSALSLDCFTCHGSVELDHTKGTSRVLLSKLSREPRQVVSICGQCHLRGGKSQSLNRNFPNTFVAGDNLFKDFKVDLSDDTIHALHAVDQHIYFNARGVAVFDKSATTCLDCHDIHGQSTAKHQQLESAIICSACHVRDSGDMQLQSTYIQSRGRPGRSRVCEY
jgi:hypothetical protein